MHAPSGGFRYRTSASRRTRNSATHPRGSARMRGALNYAKGLDGPPALAQRTIGRRRSPLNFTEFRVVLGSVIHNPIHTRRGIRSSSPVKCTARRVVSVRGYPQRIARSGLRPRIGKTRSSQRPATVGQSPETPVRTAFGGTLTIQKHSVSSRLGRGLSTSVPLRLSRQTRVRERLTRRSNG